MERQTEYLEQLTELQNRLQEITGALATERAKLEVSEAAAQNLNSQLTKWRVHSNKYKKKVDTSRCTSPMDVMSTANELITVPCSEEGT
ncbi:uncharacterized protein LAESUDRAFT_722724 [Laetiporus sulphureus 93-53]|uniref:Uncharacterized protein n=1 Tax=Laetiporus sulphureus 93-53 TaxID=1314785 RepID=A0A165G2G4_9APHY|nr:uncharacterized protein LAESUDRAFT_722724 [Laetiporus sulphureus 93-53]KZT09741.1 hypothetical protein LAESUDRAFT_722724 [Laetiporus sulphureus 93-53]